MELNDLSGLKKLDQKTNHNKHIAVVLSEANYQKRANKNSSLFQAIQQWRNQFDDDSALTETELKNVRAASQGREFSWDE